MNRCLIDTSIIIEFLRLKEKSATTLAKLNAKGFRLSVSIITYFELYAGKSIWEKSPAKKQLKTLFAGMEILELDTNIAEKAGEVRAKHGLSPMDSLIAATAIQHQRSLVTLNLKDFAHLPDLKLFSNPN